MCIISNSGSKPILALAIHWCYAKSESDPQTWREGGTKQVCEKLQRECGYYSFIYTGMKDKIMDEISEPLEDFVKGMLSDKNYNGKIGVISIHRRDNKRIKKDSTNCFTLGTLAGLTMDPDIVQELKDSLRDHNITFDDNLYFAGGKEIAFLHKKFNNQCFQDPKNKCVVGNKSTKRKKRIKLLKEMAKNSYPNRNDLQIAQLEFAGNVMKYRKRNDTPFLVCKKLGECIINYLDSND